LVLGLSELIQLSATGASDTVVVASDANKPDGANRAIASSKAVPAPAKR
jgi:hypothetical protein